MPVFISYHNADRAKALAIDSRLKAKGVPTYLDVLDTSQSADTVTDKIVTALHKCTHLMAVISPTTARSWWVPFEIGIGTERDSRITSFQLTAVEFPDYLKKWPVLEYEFQLDEFAALYLEDRVVLLEKSSYKASTTTVRNASDFHSQLKSRLRQP